MISIKYKTLFKLVNIRKLARWFLFEKRLQIMIYKSLVHHFGWCLYPYIHLTEDIGKCYFTFSFVEKIGNHGKRPEFIWPLSTQ